MKLPQAAIISAVLLAIGALSHADSAPTIHYAPAENLEHIDVELIDSAKHEIEFAAYVLTDWPVMQALIRAADRGVKVRIYLDGTQLAEREPAKVFHDLAETPGVEIRMKRSRGARCTSKATRLTAICFALARPTFQRRD
jgi:phosphatidylserine/phosphatidylglycerophosphate/cardiolipin synthase-like enzyme